MVETNGSLNLNDDNVKTKQQKKLDLELLSQRKLIGCENLTQMKVNNS